MTEPGSVTPDTTTPPQRPTGILVPLLCGALGAFGAAAGPVMVLGSLFAPIPMLPLALLLLVGIGFANAAILREVTGRRRTGLAVVLTLLALVGAGAAFPTQGEIPLGPFDGVPVTYVTAVVVAGISTFALPRWTKLVGGLTIVLVVSAYFWHTAQDATVARASELAAIELG